MKKLLLLTWMIGSSLLLSAQITVSSATFPLPGDTLRYTVAANPGIAIALYTPPGGDQIWDLSALTPAFNFETPFRPAAEGTYVNEYPEATMVVLAATNEYYYKSTTTAFEQLGHVSDSVGGLPLIAMHKNEPVLAERKAPLNFLDVNSQTTNDLLLWSYSEIPAGAIILSETPVSVRMHVSYKQVDVVDAWGTLRLPGELPQSEFPVLRLKRSGYLTRRIDAEILPFGWQDISNEIQINGSAWGSLIGVDSTVSHHYFNDVSKEEIAVLTYNTDQNAVTSVVYKNALLQTSAIEAHEEVLSGMQVYPNPTVSDITINCAHALPGVYTLKIFSSTGAIVHESTDVLSANATILTSLPVMMSGLYFCCLEDAKGNVVGTSRLMVVH
jgi:hypothetical protein